MSGLMDGKRGLVVGNFEWMATFTLILLALVFVPFWPCCYSGKQGRN